MAQNRATRALATDVGLQEKTNTIVLVAPKKVAIDCETAARDIELGTFSDGKPVPPPKKSRRSNGEKKVKPLHGKDSDGLTASDHRVNVLTAALSEATRAKGNKVPMLHINSPPHMGTWPVHLQSMVERGPKSGLVALCKPLHRSAEEDPSECKGETMSYRMITSISSWELRDTLLSIGPTLQCGWRCYVYGPKHGPAVRALAD